MRKVRGSEIPLLQVHIVCAATVSLQAAMMNFQYCSFFLGGGGGGGGGRIAQLMLTAFIANVKGLHGSDRSMSPLKVTLLNVCRSRACVPVSCLTGSCSLAPPPTSAV